MSKKYSGDNKNKDECPVCGGIIWGRGQKVIIEGARMTVCDNCAQFGTRVKNVPKKVKSTIRTSVSSGQSKKPPKPKPKTTVSAQIIDDDVDRSQIPQFFELQIKTLMESFDLAAKGHKQIVFISGPAGIGKTSLVMCAMRSADL